MAAAAAEAPPEVSWHLFDSDPYGAAYISVAPGDFVFSLDPPEPPEGWLFVKRVDNGLQGWIPPDYVAPSAFVLEEF